MAATSPFSELIRMLETFVDGASEARGTNFVRKIEAELVRLELDEDEAFSDFQHSLAMYHGSEGDIRELKNEALFAIGRLHAKEQNA